jgi:hypothetical protein
LKQANHHDNKNNDRWKQQLQRHIIVSLYFPAIFAPAPPTHQSSHLLDETWRDGLEYSGQNSGRRL